MKKTNKTQFLAAVPHSALTTGEVIRMLRDLREWTQAELALLSGISTTNLSLLENGKVQIGKRRAEQLAKAFGVHPGIIMFPEYDSAKIKNVA